MISLSMAKSLLTAALFTAGYLLLQIIISLGAIIWQEKLPLQVTEWLITLSYTLGVIVVVAIGRRYYEVFLFRIRAINFVIPIGIGVLCYYMEIILKTRSIDIQTEAPSYLLSNLVLMIIVIPALEEYIFRGIILTEFISHDRKWSGIIISSVLFSAIHLDVTTFVEISVFGLLSGLMYIKYKNIYAPYLLHATYNGFILSAGFQ